jgi:hypothetical protein
LIVISYQVLPSADPAEGFFFGWPELNLVRAWLEQYDLKWRIRLVDTGIFCGGACLRFPWTGQ